MHYNIGLATTAHASVHLALAHKKHFTLQIFLMHSYRFSKCLLYSLRYLFFPDPELYFPDIGVCQQWLRCNYKLNIQKQQLTSPTAFRQGPRVVTLRNFCLCLVATFCKPCTKKDIKGTPKFPVLIFTLLILAYRKAVHLKRNLKCKQNATLHRRLGHLCNRTLSSDVEVQFLSSVQI
jgi:hypothetical protein